MSNRDLELLAQARQSRETGQLPHAEEVFLFSQIFERLTNRELKKSPRFRELSEQMDELKQAHGIGEDWAPGDGPPEYDTLHAEYEQLIATFTAETMREHGETELAELFENDRETFDRLDKEGRSTFHAPPDLLD